MQPDEPLTDIQRQKLWEYVRGDADAQMLEAWIYDDTALEGALGDETYLQLVGCNFGNRQEVFVVKALMRAILEPFEACHCASVRNLDAIEMGGDWFFQKFFATLTECVRPSSEQWWLYISRCDTCATNWLVAQEERINDMFYVRRISDHAVGQARNGHWPAQFQTYADVLQTGLSLGARQSQFIDPMSGALQVTVEDLLRTNPRLTAPEIGRLLGIDPQHAQALMAKVSRDGADPLAGSINTPRE